MSAEAEDEADLAAALRDEVALKFAKERAIARVQAEDNE